MLNSSLLSDQKGDNEPVWIVILNDDTVSGFHSLVIILIPRSVNWRPVGGKTSLRLYLVTNASLYSRIILLLSD